MQLEIANITYWCCH